MDFSEENTDLKKDSLTGLYDRKVIVEYAKELIQEGTPFSLMLIDIDNFKNVNDSYGHSIGDKIICEVAGRIKQNISGTGIAGRFGGDEFIIVVKNIVDYDAIWTVCKALTTQIDGFSVPDYPGCFITCTLGLSRFSEDGKDYDTLMEKADKALYRGKIKGRSCFIIYLDSKHKDIKLHSSEDTTATPMQRLTTMYRIFTAQGNLKDGIKAVLENFSSSMMIDHLGIQSDSELLFSTVYPLSEFKEFSYIDNKLVIPNLGFTNSVFFFNDREHLKFLKQDELYGILVKQHIKSQVFVAITYKDKLYGFIRGDAAGNSRIWQHDDLELLVSAANTIGMALHYEGTDLTSLQ